MVSCYTAAVSTVQCSYYLHLSNRTCHINTLESQVDVDANVLSFLLSSHLFLLHSLPSPSYTYTIPYLSMIGNFSPNTQAGYTLVYCLGWVSIIAFGILSIVAGYTYTTIADDLFRRLNMKWLHKPEYSVPLWAILSLLWINLIAWNARSYWKTRVPEYDYTVGNSYWFSYISIFTVGLGDVFLQPQGMFISDVFRWTALFLNGFVFISAFLGKFGDLLIKYFPSRGESLEYHLARTDLWGIGTYNYIVKAYSCHVASCELSTLLR